MFSAPKNLVLLALVGLSYGEIVTNLPYHMRPYNASAIQIPNEDTSHYGTGNCWTAASNANGAVVTIQKCTGAASQSWTFSAGAPSDEGPGSVGTIKIYGNKCLDVSNGANQSGTKLQIWTCSANNKNQQWIITNGETSLVTVKWATTSKCLDLTGGNQAIGTPLQIWTCSESNNNQKWAPQYAASAPPSDNYNIWLRSHIPPPTPHDLCMTVRNATLNNTPVIMNYCDQGGNFITWHWQQGTLRLFGEVDYCLDVTNGADVDGTKLQIYACSKGNKNQQWQFNSNLSLQWVGHNKCIDLTDGKLAAGNQLQIYSCFNDNKNQQWDIVPVYTA